MGDPSAEGFGCQTDEQFRGACKGLPSYREYEGKQYCVLHFHSKTKRADTRFQEALQKKKENEDFDFSGVYFPSIFEEFKGFEFETPASFSGATFSEGVTFGGAVFSGEADFYGATFGGEAHFYETTFSGEASFGRAAFSGQADFGRATFSRKADFSGATFSERAHFYSGLQCG